MNDKRYIDIDGVIYSVDDYDSNFKLKKGWAYIIKEKNLVLPYLGKLKDFSAQPGIYIHMDETKIIKPLTKKTAKKYRPKKVYTVDLNFINQIIEKDGVRDTSDLEVLLSESDEIFTPPILEDDNALQRLIKQALERKQIDLKNYMSRFDGPSNMNNTKRSLLHHGKMSFEKYLKWCEVLDLNFEIRLIDTPQSVHPMNDEIIYRYK